MQIKQEEKKNIEKSAVLNFQRFASSFTESDNNMCCFESKWGYYFL